MRMRTDAATADTVLFRLLRLLRQSRSRLYKKLLEKEELGLLSTSESFKPVEQNLSGIC